MNQQFGSKSSKFELYVSKLEVGHHKLQHKFLSFEFLGLRQNNWSNPFNQKSLLKIHESLAVSVLAWGWNHINRNQNAYKKKPMMIQRFQTLPFKSKTSIEFRLWKNFCCMSWNIFSTIYHKCSYAMFRFATWYHIAFRLSETKRACDCSCFKINQQDYIRSPKEGITIDWNLLLMGWTASGGTSGEASLQLGHCKWGSGVCVCGVCSGSYNLQASVQPLGFVFGTETAEGKGIHNLFNPVEIVADIISGQKNAKLFSALLVCWCCPETVTYFIFVSWAAYCCSNTVYCYSEYNALLPWLSLSSGHR